MLPLEQSAKLKTHQRTGRRLVAGLIAVFVASVGLAACGTAGSASPSVNHPAAAMSTPRGWKTYVYERTAVSAPANWRVVTDYVCPEAIGPGTLFLGPPKESAVGCAGIAQLVDMVALADFPDAVSDPKLSSCALTRVHGLEVYVGPCSSSDEVGPTWWVVPALGVQAQATQRAGGSVGKQSTTLVGRVLHTLRQATAKEVIASSPVDWPTYTYRSVAISVPISWTVRRDQNCPDPSAEGTLELGLPTVDSTCTALAYPTASVTLSALSPEVNYRSCLNFRVNGLRAYVDDCETRPPDGVTNWAVPALGLDVSAGPNSSALVGLVLHTLRLATLHDITASAPLSLSLTLRHTRVIAGTPIKGTAIFTNRGGSPITVETCAADGWLEVGLTNRNIPYYPASPLIVCPPMVQLVPGETRVPITIVTTYQACTQSSSSSTTPEVPSCAGGPPPLPAGTYHTKVITTGLPPDMATPNVVRVTLTHDPDMRG